MLLGRKIVLTCKRPIRCRRQHFCHRPISISSMTQWVWNTVVMYYTLPINVLPVFISNVTRHPLSPAVKPHTCFYQCCFLLMWFYILSFVTSAVFTLTFNSWLYQRRFYKFVTLLVLAVKISTTTTTTNTFLSVSLVYLYFTYALLHQSPQYLPSFLHLAPAALDLTC